VLFEFRKSNFENVIEKIIGLSRGLYVILLKMKLCDVKNRKMVIEKIIGLPFEKKKSNKYRLA
jgi:uncharacterized protein Smg (DUF494 family)